MTKQMFVEIFMYSIKILQTNCYNSRLIQIESQISDRISSSVSYQWVSEALLMGIKRREREADHSHPSSADVKNSFRRQHYLRTFKLLSCVITINVEHLAYYDTSFYQTSKNILI
jgi:hypothetical protein